MRRTSVQEEVGGGLIDNTAVLMNRTMSSTLLRTRTLFPTASKRYIPWKTLLYRPGSHKLLTVFYFYWPPLGAQIWVPFFKSA